MRYYVAVMNSRYIKFAWHIVALVAIVALALFLASLAKENELIRAIVLQYGYVGVFVVALICGFNLAVPIPAAAFLPLFLASGLGFWTSILFMSLGTTAADLLAYALSRVGRNLASHSLGERENKVFERIERIREKYSWGPIALLFAFAAVVPFPNEILVIPLGFLNYRLRYIFFAVFAGNFVFNTLYATGIIQIFGDS